MNDDNLLSDIENDIFGNWEDIQTKLRNKKYEEKVLKNPQRIDCPSFMEFYKILLQIMQSWDTFENPDPRLLMELHKLLRNIFYEIEDWPNPLPDSFHRIWELFCNPRKYKCDLNLNCPSCHKNWDVVFKQKILSANINDLIGHEAERYETVVENSRIACPDCGYQMKAYMGREVVGIFRSDHDGEYEYDFRRKFS